MKGYAYGNLVMLKHKQGRVVAGVNILSPDPLGPSFQQKKIELKSVHKLKSFNFKKARISNRWPKYSPLALGGGSQ